MRVHLWSGLVTGPLFLVLGISGAALVFRPELDDALTGRAAVAPGAAPSWDTVLRAALLSHPGAAVRAVRIPASPGRPYRVELDHAAQRIDVAVDPSTLRVVGSRAPERSVFAAIHSLHAALHAGRGGAAAVAVLGLWLVVESLSGLWLYGPSVRARVGSGKGRRSRRLHRLVGAASVAIGVVVGITGALLALASAFGPAAVVHRPPRDGLARLDAVAARIERASPGAHIAAFVAEADRRARVDVRASDGGRHAMRVDLRTTEILSVDTPPVGAWERVRQLHAGDFGGPLARILYAGVGLALPVLSITGFAISARRQSSKVLT